MTDRANLGAWVLGLGLIATWACGSTPNVTCGVGAHLEGNVCVASSEGTAPVGGGAVDVDGVEDDSAGGASGAGAESPSEPSDGGSPDGGSSDGGSSDGGNSSGPSACKSGTVACACDGETCEKDLACRQHVCVAVPRAPESAVAGHYRLPPTPVDVALDRERHRLFASYGEDGVVRALNLDDGQLFTVTTGHRAEHLFFEPVRDEVLTSVPVAEHSNTWFDNQQGYVVAIDAVTLNSPSPVSIPLDPWAIVGDGRGHAIVNGASGQWTQVLSVDLDTGQFQGNDQDRTYQRTSLAIHPDGGRVYGASLDGLERSELSPLGELSGRTSSTSLSYEACGDLRIHPLGDTIYTPCGNIFTASAVPGTDMRRIADLGQRWIDLAFDDSARYALLLVRSARAVYIFDTQTLKSSGTMDADPAERILMGAGYFVLVRQALEPEAHTDVEVVRFDP